MAVEKKEYIIPLIEQTVWRVGNDSVGKKKNEGTERVNESGKNKSKCGDREGISDGGSKKKRCVEKEDGEQKTGTSMPRVGLMKTEEERALDKEAADAIVKGEQHCSTIHRGCIF